MNKTIWLTAYLFLLVMFYISCNVCFMSEMHILGWIFVISFGILMVKLGEYIIKE